MFAFVVVLAHGPAMGCELRLGEHDFPSQRCRRELDDTLYIEIDCIFTLPLPLMAQFTVNQPIPQTATIRLDAAVSAGSAIPRKTAPSFDGNVLRHVFPHESVTVIQIQKAAQ